MSIPDTGSGKNGVKTLAIRLEPTLHAQLTVISQLRGSTITDEIRQAIEAHLELAKQSPELAAQADSVLADIDREASARRDALTNMFGDTGDKPGASRGRASSRRLGKEDPSA